MKWLLTELVDLITGSPITGNCDSALDKKTFNLLISWLLKNSRFVQHKVGYKGDHARKIKNNVAGGDTIHASS
jgi:hypothetical protein